LPAAEKGQASTAKTGVMDERPSSSNGAGSIPKSPLDAGVTEKIASCRSDLGVTLYADILQRVARVHSPRDIANQKLQQIVLGSMETCLRAMRRIREIATKLPEAKFYTILDDIGVPSLDRIPVSRSSRSWRMRCTQPRNPWRNRHAVRTGKGRRPASLSILR
jgi:hypothetical protein